VVRGNALYDSLCNELHFGFRRIGELNVALSEADLPALQALKKQGDEKGVPGLELWDQVRLRREEPNLSRELLGALYAPSAGVINPYEFAFALVESAVRNGLELRVDSPVSAIEKAGDRLKVTTRGGAVTGAGSSTARASPRTPSPRWSAAPTSRSSAQGEEYMLDKRLKGSCAGSSSRCRPRRPRAPSSSPPSTGR